MLKYYLTPLRKQFGEVTKFGLVQPRNILIIRTKKCLVDLTKYLVDSTKLFGCFNQIGIFSKFNQKIYFNEPKVQGYPTKQFCWFIQAFFCVS